MSNSLLKYSRQELVRLLQSSLAVANMDKKQRELLHNVIIRSSEEQLVDLFVMLRNERQFLDRTEEEFNKKFIKTMDDFVMSTQAAVYKIKHKQASHEEKKADKKEKKIEQELLKKLKQV